MSPHSTDPQTDTPELGSGPSHQDSSRIVIQVSTSTALQTGVIARPFYFQEDAKAFSLQLDSTLPAPVVRGVRSTGRGAYTAPRAFVSDYLENEIHLSFLSPTKPDTLCEDGVRPSFTCLSEPAASEWPMAFSDEMLLTRVVYKGPPGMGATC